MENCESPVATLIQLPVHHPSLVVPACTANEFQGCTGSLPCDRNPNLIRELDERGLGVARATIGDLDLADLAASNPGYGSRLSGI